MSHTILLVPTPGDPHGLLKPGVCGAMPPRVERCTCGAWYAPSGFGARRRHEAHRATDGDDTEALVLAWKGAVVPEGVDRAARVLRGHGWWKDTPRRLRCWAKGDFTATYLIDPSAPVSVVVFDPDLRPPNPQSTESA